MKVTLLNDSFPPVIDGVANVVMNYAKILQEEKLADVMVATPAYPGAEYHSYPYWVVPYQSFDTTKIVKGYRAGNPLDVKEIVTMKEFAPDIIHSHCPVSSTLLARTLRFYTDAPLVFTYHTKFDIDIAKAVKSKLLQKEAIHALVSNIEACDEVWVVSRGAGENLRCLGYTGEYRVVSNGVDFAKGRVAPEKVAKVTDSYDLPEGIPVFLFVGRIVKYKGLPLILDALAKLSQDGVDFRMVFVGSGPDEKEMKEKAASLLKPEQYIFTGAVYDREQLRAWNTRADLFLPEKEESFEVGSGTHVYEYDTNTSLKELKFTLDSTLGEILDEPLGMKMMEEMLPELVHNPMIEYARQMTLAEGISSAPEVKAVYEAVLKELNAQM